MTNPTKSISSSPQWHRVCAVDELDENQAVALPVKPPVAVFRVNGSFYATDDTCTHATFSLAKGYIDDDCTVECDLHLAKFCIKTGQVLNGPASIPLAVYPVRIEEQTVYVDLAARG